VTTVKRKIRLKNASIISDVADNTNDSGWNNPNLLNLILAKVPDLSNRILACINVVCCLIGVGVSVASMPRDIVTGNIDINDKQMVAGPMFEGSEIYYLLFISYLFYDTIAGFFVITASAESATSGGFDWSMTLHHILFLMVACIFYHEQAFPLVACVLLFAELSSPFVSLLLTLRDLKLTKTTLYTINGMIMTLSFFAVRIVCQLLALVHLALHFNSQVKADLNAARVICISIVCIGYCLQVFWFGKIAKGLLKLLKPQSKDTQSDKEELVDDESDMKGLLAGDAAAGKRSSSSKIPQD